ncbi:helicase-related protein [Terrabacter sp. BE26]|uniref:helicase-related protein n=1 Tax=Terrabacter sp. BE26 TaxID=2898152 RepID=UPI0035BE119A
MRALGFCVSREHAHYMADVFTRAGIRSAVVLGDTAPGERDRHLGELRGGRLQALFTVDVFNEGVDVPAINTVLFLRPTESSTVFLQQLGRGLRRAPGKAVLTALDFVGHHRKEFRFDQRFRAVTGATRSQLVHDIERGFPFLPAGTQIVLDRLSEDLVLRNIREQVWNRWTQIAAELRAHPTPDLGAFLSDSGVDLADVLRGDRSWTRLRRDAGITTPEAGPLETGLLKRVRALAHVDDPARVAAYRRWLSADAPAYDETSAEVQLYARMLFFSLFPGGGGFGSYDEGLAAVRREAAVCEGLRAVLDLGVQNAAHVTRPLLGAPSDRPLRVHARYTREEARSTRLRRPPRAQAQQLP